VVAETQGAEEYVHLKSLEDEFHYMESTMPKKEGGGEAAEAEAEAAEAAEAEAHQRQYEEQQHMQQEAEEGTRTGVGAGADDRGRAQGQQGEDEDEDEEIHRLARAHMRQQQQQEQHERRRRQFAAAEGEGDDADGVAYGDPVDCGGGGGDSLGPSPCAPRSAAPGGRANTSMDDGGNDEADPFAYAARVDEEEARQGAAAGAASASGAGVGKGKGNGMGAGSRRGSRNVDHLFDPAVDDLCAASAAAASAAASVAGGGGGASSPSPLTSTAGPRSSRSWGGAADRGAGGRDEEVDEDVDGASRFQSSPASAAAGTARAAGDTGNGSEEVLPRTASYESLHEID
jgi:hypothetical protein